MANPRIVALSAETLESGSAFHVDPVGAKICWYGVRASVVVALSASAAQLIDFAIVDQGIRLLDMKTHASVFGVVSLLALCVACGAALLLAADSMPSRTLALLPPLLAVLLGLRLLHPDGVILFALPFAVATLALLWRHVGVPGSDAQRVIRAGCVTLGGAYLVHAFGGSPVVGLGYGDDTWPYEARLLVSHVGELAGWMVVATGLVAAFVGARRNG